MTYVLLLLGLFGLAAASFAILFGDEAVSERARFAIGLGGAALAIVAVALV